MTLLLAANNGGHIEQLRVIAERLDVGADRVWVTVPTPQTESMLEGQQVHWVRPAVTRDWRAAASNARLVAPLFKRHDFSHAISTGSSLAVSVLPQAAVRRIPAHYVESVTRSEGISLSGKMLQRIPGVTLYVQWPHLANGKWIYRGSVLDGTTTLEGPPRRVKRIVVSLGTHQKYGFRRLVERLVDVLPSDVEVTWQTGSTDCSNLPIEARADVPAQEFEQRIAECDVLVAHAGAGIALTALKQGKVPLLVPRRAEHHEHVDDHQQQIARMLSDRGLAMVREADDVSWMDVEQVATHRAVPAPQVPVFSLLTPSPAAA